MNLFLSASSSCSVASKNQLVRLLVRGIAGIGLMYYSLNMPPKSALFGWGLLAVAIYLLKGCPTCWGMHLVNALRNTRKSQSTPVSGQQELQRTQKKQYSPKDMADHLFPPEDVNCFRQNNQQA